MRRSLLVTAAVAAVSIPLAGAPAAPAQDPGQTVDDAHTTVRNICVLREGKYCVTTLGDVLDRLLRP